MQLDRISAILRMNDERGHERTTKEEERAYTKPAQSQQRLLGVTVASQLRRIQHHRSDDE